MTAVDSLEHHSPVPLHEELRIEAALAYPSAQSIRLNRMADEAERLTRPPGGSERLLPVEIHGRHYEVPVAVQLHIVALRERHSPVFSELRGWMEHCVSAADEGEDYACPRSMLDALTTLGLMEKCGRGKWRPTEKGESLASPQGAEQRQEAFDEWADDHLTNGVGHAPASTYVACRAAFDAAWPDGQAAANKAALAAHDRCHPPKAATPHPAQAATQGDAALPERDPTKPNSEQGLYRKFYVRRTDGSDAPGGKHDGCEYFVLDVRHDPLAMSALAAYAEAAKVTHPDLARDLIDRYALSSPTGVQAAQVFTQMRQLLTLPAAEPADAGRDAVAFCNVEDAFDNDSILRQMGVKRGDKLYTRPPSEAAAVDDGLLRDARVLIASARQNAYATGYKPTDKHDDVLARIDAALASQQAVKP